MKLEAGMYVRTIGGLIVKITGIDNNFINVDGVPYNKESFIKDIIKARYKPIDLIEVGDYVNGCKVHKIANCITIILDNEENISWVNPSDIKSIVTKEQFESVEYKVGE